MDKARLTKKRIILAFAIAVVADIIQFPITAAEATGFLSVPGELSDFMVDCVVMAATTALLGFHWMLLPSLCLELIPGLDVLPTWTACVGYVVWRRTKEQQQSPPPRPVVNIQELKNISPAPALMLAETPPEPPARAGISAPPQPPSEPAIEARLKSLNNLRDKNLISQIEYEAKRHEILAEI